MKEFSERVEIGSPPYRGIVCSGEQNIELGIRNDWLRRQTKEALVEADEVETKRIVKDFGSKMRVVDRNVLRLRKGDMKAERQMELSRLREPVLVDRPSYYRTDYDWYRRSSADEFFGEQVEMIDRDPDSEESWKMRESILLKIEEENVIGDVVSQNELLKGTDRDLFGADFKRLGIDTNKLIDDSYLNEGKVRKTVRRIECLLQTLRGVDSDKSWEWRDFLVKKLETFSRIPHIYTFRADTRYSSIFKKKWHLPNEDERVEILMRSLIGVDSETAWKMRIKYENEYPEWTAISLCGLTGYRSLRARRRLMEECPLAVAVSLSNLEDSFQILDLKEELLNRSRNDLSVLEALSSTFPSGI